MIRPGSYGKTWMKRNGELFSVEQGAYDGAAICELVGLYLLHEMHEHFPAVDFGLYRDDGMGAHENLSGPNTERLRKKIIKLFKENGLDITFETNLIDVNFLDVSFSLVSGKYKPYRKPNNDPLYSRPHKSWYFLVPICTYIEFFKVDLLFPINTLNILSLVQR